MDTKPGSFLKSGKNDVTGTLEFEIKCCACYEVATKFYYYHPDYCRAACDNCGKIIFSANYKISKKEYIAALILNE